jgi:hypothetical protein
MEIRSLSAMDNWMRRHILGLIARIIISEKKILIGHFRPCSNFASSVFLRRFCCLTSLYVLYVLTKAAFCLLPPGHFLRDLSSLSSYFKTINLFLSGDLSRFVLTNQTSFLHSLYLFLLSDDSLMLGPHFLLQIEQLGAGALHLLFFDVLPPLLYDLLFPLIYCYLTSRFLLTREA